MLSIVVGVLVGAVVLGAAAFARKRRVGEKNAALHKGVGVAAAGFVKITGRKKLNVRCVVRVNCLENVLSHVFAPPPRLFRWWSLA